MEVKINKEIRNYTESMFFGLSMRQFLFSVLACGVAVGLFFLLRGRFGTETLSWMCILGAAPFAVMGFVRYNGMTAEQFVWAWIKSQFLMPKSVQAVIPLKTMWEDGIFLVDRNKYAKTFKFEDINYAVASRDDKEAMFLEYSELLNATHTGGRSKAEETKPLQRLP